MGDFHQEYNDDSLGQHHLMQNNRRLLSELQDMITALSANQIELYNLENGVIKRNQEVLRTTMGRVSAAVSQVIFKMEGLCPLLASQNELAKTVFEDVTNKSTQILQSVTLLTTKTINLSDILTSTSNSIKAQHDHISSLQTKIDSQTQTINSLSSFTSADRQLLVQTVSRQENLEKDVHDIKGTLAEILSLLKSGVAVVPAAAKGEKLIEEDKDDDKDDGASQGEKGGETENDGDENNDDGDDKNDDGDRMQVESTADGGHTQETEEIEEEDVAQLTRKNAKGKGKVLVAEERKIAPKDTSDKVVRELFRKHIDSENLKHDQWVERVKSHSSSSKLRDFEETPVVTERPQVAEQSNIAPTQVMWDPHGPINDELLAAAQGESLEYVKAQRRQEEEDEATRKLIEDLAKKDIEECEEIKKTSKNIDPKEVLKQTHEEFEQKLAEDKLKFVAYMDRRVKDEKIVEFSATLHDKGSRICAKVRREGAKFSRTIERLERKHFGISEWVEIFHLINKRRSVSCNAVLSIIERLFESIKGMEKKLALRDSALDRMLCHLPPPPRKLPPPLPPPTQVTSNLSHFFQQPFTTLTQFQTDECLNTSLPAGIPFVEGKVIDNPAGIFYDNVHGGKRFFRLSEVSIASTRFLMAIRKRCAVTTNAHEFIKAIDQELTKPERLRDPDFQIIKAESVWD